MAETAAVETVAVFDCLESLCVDSVGLEKRFHMGAPIGALLEINVDNAVDLVHGNKIYNFLLLDILCKGRGHDYFLLCFGTNLISNTSPLELLFSYSLIAAIAAGTNCA